MKRWLVMLVGVLLLAACQSQSAVDKYDLKDPQQAHCNTDAQTLPGTARAVYLPGGKKFGTLVVRQSLKCQTVWGEINVPSSRPSGYVQVTITLWRPDDGKSVAYTTTSYGNPIWGNMLWVHEHCVRASASVEGPDQKHGPTVTTKCTGLQSVGDTSGK